MHSYRAKIVKIFTSALMKLCMKPYAHHGAIILTFLQAAWKTSSFPKASLASRLTLAGLRMRLTAYSPRSGKPSWSACSSSPLKKSIALGRRCFKVTRDRVVGAYNACIASKLEVLMEVVGSTQRRARQLSWACNFESAEALVKGLAAIPTIALPTLFRLATK
ncbi:hypothetical protein EDC04DRAFT_2655839 [Pisolithus marmoratus]|nr:hypothetical protein EDC04DRAFT_2655839 [Pisolithus marmoratus]